MDQAVPGDLDHQHHQPDQAEGDVQPVGAHQREEGRQEGAALRARAFMDQVVELVEFQAQEAQAEQARDRQPAQRAAHVALLLLQHGEAEGDGRQQQEGRVDGHQREVEQLCAGRAGGVAAAQHAVGGEQRGEDEAVAHQVEPEAQRGAVLWMGLLREVVVAGSQGACGAGLVTDIRHGSGRVGVCGLLRSC